MPRLLSWHALRKGILIIPGEGRFVKVGESDGSAQGVVKEVAGMVE